MAAKKKTAAKAAEKPGLTEILAKAGSGYARSMKGLMQFCIAYVDAVELYGQEGRREKRHWAEAEAAFAGVTLPAAEQEEDLAAFLRRLKDMEANGAPAAALVANLLALAREAAV